MSVPKPSWKHPRFLADLTPHQAQAMVRCHAQVVLLADDGHKAAGIPTVTLTTLVDTGYLSEQRDKRSRPVWKPTARGLDLIQAEQPRYLSRAADHMDPGTDSPGYTVNPAKAMFPDAGEAVDVVTQARLSREGNEHDELRAAGVDEADLAILAGMRDQRREYARIAAERGFPVRNEIRMLDQAENSFLRKLHARRTSRTAA